MPVTNLHPLLPLAAYRILIGGALLLAGAIWVAFIFWLTRHKKPKTIASLGNLPPVLPDLGSLKPKYLQLIAGLAQQYDQKQITARQLHQELSKTVRLFVYEAKGAPAPKLTLAELKRAALPSLAALIASYYPDEFDKISHGVPRDAIEGARKLVSEWR